MDLEDRIMELEDQLAELQRRQYYGDRDRRRIRHWLTLQARDLPSEPDRHGSTQVTLQ